MERLNELIAHANRNGHKVVSSRMSKHGAAVYREGKRIGKYKNEADTEGIDIICFKIESFCFSQA